MERKEGEEERILQTKADTNNSLLHFLPPTHTHLSCEGQKIVVEVYVGHNIGEVFRVLALLLLQLQKHLLTTHHEGELLTNKPGVQSSSNNLTWVHFLATPTRSLATPTHLSGQLKKISRMRAGLLSIMARRRA